MKFLIAGYGSIGRRHFRNLLALGERDIVLYRTGKSTLPDDELAGFPVETGLQRALDHRPQAVIVANPTAFHLEIAVPAAQAGYHLFLEKPISHTLERVDELQAAQHMGGGQIFVGFQFRFHPGLQKIAGLLQAGAIGRPLSARAHWGEYLPNWHPWEDYRQGYSARADLGGGVIFTLCHPLDYLRWLLGEVEALWAFAGKLSDLQIEVEDTAEIGLRFANGVIGSVHLDYNQRPAAHHLEIVGTLGTVRWDNADGAVHLHQSQNSKQEWTTYLPPASSSPDSIYDRNDMFLREMQHFLAVARGQVQPLCSLQDGIQALRLALAVYKSAEIGKQIVL